MEFQLESFRTSHSQPRPRSQQFPFVLHLKKHLVGQKFHEGEVKNAVTTWLCAQVAEFYDIGIQKLIPRLNKCHNKGVEKQQKVCVKEFFTEFC